MTSLRKARGCQPCFQGQERGPGNYKPTSLILFPGKVKEIILETTFKHVKEKKVTGSNHH